MKYHAYYTAGLTLSGKVGGEDDAVLVWCQTRGADGVKAGGHALRHNNLIMKK